MSWHRAAVPRLPTPEAGLWRRQKPLRFVYAPNLREAGISECRKCGKEVWCVQTDAVARSLRDMADAAEPCCPNATRLARRESGPKAIQISTRGTKRSRQRSFAFCR